MKRKKVAVFFLAIVTLFSLSLNVSAGGLHPGEVDSTPPNQEAIAEAIASEQKAKNDGSLSLYASYTAPVVGTVYNICSVASTNSYLNVWGGIDKDGTRIDMWQGDGSTEQKFKVIKGSTTSVRRLQALGGNTGRVLDAYRPIVSGCSVDIWTSNDAPAQDLIFTPISGNKYKITLASYPNLALTAVSLSDDGAVQFQTFSSTNTRQQWYFEEVTAPKNPYASLGWKYMFRTTSTGAKEDLSKSSGNYAYDPNGSISPWYHKHWGIDIITKEGVELFSSTNGIVIASGGALFQETTPSGSPHKEMGYFVTVNTQQADPVSGRTMYIRYLHMQLLPSVKYNQSISKSTLLGYVGSTGDSSTPHLHFDINTKTSLQYYGDGYSTSNTINPVNFFPQVSFPSHYYTYGSYITRSSNSAAGLSGVGTSQKYNDYEMVPGTYIDAAFIKAVGTADFEAWAAKQTDADAFNLQTFVADFHLTDAACMQIIRSNQLQEVYQSEVRAFEAKE